MTEKILALIGPRQHPLGDENIAAAEKPAADYTAPTLFVIGESRELLRGSGRHKNDDTGSRGFEVG